jgi:hypothetical protein
MTDRSQSSARLQGSWLTIARAAWLVFFALSLLALGVAFPAHWAELTRPAPIMLANLNSLGWSVTLYAVYSITTEVIFTAAFLGVALIIFARRSNERMALFTSLMLVAFGVGNGTITPVIGALGSYPFGYGVIAFFGYAAWVTFTQFPYLFPSGRYVPGWARVPALIWFLICIPWNFMSGSALDPLTWPPAVFGPIIFGLYVTWLVSQISRYRHVSNPVERQQTKWVVYALVMAIATELTLGSFFLFRDYTLVNYLSSGVPPTPEALSSVLILQGAVRFSFLLLPLGFAFSILRYRLWDIDVFIRKSLVYGILTILLALVYFGGVTLVQGLLSAVSGQQSAIGIVISTLMIAALFSPLRRRVQDFIDRRFFRRKYDAERALAAFARTARDEVDAGRLTETLVGVVRETIQPESIWLWLKGAGRERSQ